MNSALDEGREGACVCVCVCTRLLHRWATETGGEESWSICPWDRLTGCSCGRPAVQVLDEPDSEYRAEAMQQRKGWEASFNAFKCSFYCLFRCICVCVCKRARWKCRPSSIKTCFFSRCGTLEVVYSLCLQVHCVIFSGTIKKSSLNLFSLRNATSSFMASLRTCLLV